MCSTVMINEDRNDEDDIDDEWDNNECLYLLMASFACQEDKAKAPETSTPPMTIHFNK